MMRTSRCLWQAAAAATTAGQPSAAAPAVSKLKAEMWKMMKIQLALMPIVAFILIVFFPPPSVEEEKRMRIEYEKNAGWKT